MKSKIISTINAIWKEYNRKMELSIIVPVYNANKYINKCVHSILSQTFKDFELILVDDGSTDNSYELCKELEKKDKRIKVYHKENGGYIIVEE